MRHASSIGTRSGSPNSAAVDDSTNRRQPALIAASARRSECATFSAM
jgi:hypothetical protein